MRPYSWEHVRNDVPAADKHTAQVGAVDEIEVVAGKLPQRCGRADDSGVIHEDVNAAPGGHHLLDGCCYPLLVAHVGHRQPRRDPLGRQRLDGAATAGLVNVNHKYLCALAPQAAGDAEANPGGRSGHHRHPVGKSLHSSLLSSVCSR